MQFTKSFDTGFIPALSKHSQKWCDISRTQKNLSNENYHNIFAPKNYDKKVNIVLASILFTRWKSNLLRQFLVVRMFKLIRYFHEAENS